MIVRVKPNPSPMRHLPGRLLEKQGRISDARKIYAQGLQRLPEDTDLLDASDRLGK